MLLELNVFHKNTYGFQFKSGKTERIAQIHMIGKEEQTCARPYDWNCEEREDPETYIFQYTLAGQGEIVVKGVRHQLEAGDGFFISIPQDCRYFLPKDSLSWSFIFITLKGSEAKRCWEDINENYGYVFNMKETASLIQNLMAIYDETSEGKIQNGYQTSSKAFEFITHVYDHFEKFDTSKPQITPDIEAAIEFIKSNYFKPIALYEIAEVAELSKFYFVKKFKDQTNLAPLAYLNQYRMEKSLYLLQHTTKKIKDISMELGFSDSNYFCKVFRNYMHVSPGEFRKNNVIPGTIGYVITDTLDELSK